VGRGLCRHFMLAVQSKPIETQTPC
jgi:hypothetical protein